MLLAVDTLGWTAMALVGSGMGLLIVGLLYRVYEREEELARILDLPYGEQDVDVADVTQYSSLVEGTIGLAGRFIEQLDERGFIRARLEQARIPVRPGEFALFVAGGALVLGLLVSAITTSVVMGGAAVVASPFLALALVDRRIRSRTKAFEAAFPDALSLIASSLSAGHTFLRSIQMMTEEATGPLADEFGRVVAETQLGDPLVDCLDRMASRVDIRDVQWVVQAIRIQQTVGGKLADLLHTLADFIRAREEIRREVDVLTAEGRMSAWVLGGLPVFLLLIIQTLNPGYMDPMFRGWGLWWLGGAALISAGAIAIIMRMVRNVEV